MKDDSDVGAEDSREDEINSYSEYDGDNSDDETWEPKKRKRKDVKEEGSDQGNSEEDLELHMFTAPTAAPIDIPFARGHRHFRR